MTFHNQTHSVRTSVLVFHKLNVCQQLHLGVKTLICFVWVLTPKSDFHHYIKKSTDEPIALYLTKNHFGLETLHFSSLYNKEDILQGADNRIRTILGDKSLL